MVGGAPSLAGEVGPPIGVEDKSRPPAAGVPPMLSLGNAFCGESETLVNGGDAGVRGESEAFVEGVATSEGIGEPSLLEVGAAAAVAAAAGWES